MENTGGRVRAVAVSGSSGLIGAALCKRLDAEGYLVRRIVRQREKAGPQDIYWDQQLGTLDATALEWVDAVFHLAGENIAQRRWSPEQKERLRASRVDSAQMLARTLAALDKPPQALICASAIGYYGDRGDEVLTEESGAGSGFLAELVVDWEAACTPASAAGIRVANTRFGVVLSSEGGALKQLIPPFKLGLGGRLGSGKQYFSWVHLEDLLRALEFVLRDTRLRGPVNVTSPNPVTNEEFTRTLAHALGRPVGLPVPSAALRMALGEIANELTGSCRVLPAKLTAAGFEFRYDDLEAALAEATGRATADAR